MKINETPKITSINDYRKSKNINTDNVSLPSAPAKITKFEVLSAMHPKVQEPMSKEEVRALLAPDSAKQSSNQAPSVSPFGKSPIVDFMTISSLYPNIKKSKETELIEFFLAEGYNLTYQQAEDALKKYSEDAEEAKPIFKQIDAITKEFEEKIKDIDFKSLDKINSIFKKKDRREMFYNCETPDSFIPSKQSNRVTKNIAKLYINFLKEALPEYKIEIEDDGTVDPTSDVTQISVEKDGNSMLFFYDDFISTLKKGKLNQNTKFILETPENEPCYWCYDGSEKILNKIRKTFHGVIGSISKDAYNEQGEAEFYVDTMYESGPCYYGLVETMKTPKDEAERARIDDPGDMTEEEIATAKAMAESAPEINKYYKDFGLQFVNSCIRDGSFNLGIAMAETMLLELGHYFSKDGEISLDYVKEIISHIEKKNNYSEIDEDVFSVANDMLVKELNSNEDHHKTVFSVLDYVMKNPSEKNIDFASNIADELFSFEEVDKIMNMLNSSSPKKQNVIVLKLNKLVRKFDESGALKPEVRIYEQLMREIRK